jgi:hypothetical protein
VVAPGPGCATGTSCSARTSPRRLAECAAPLAISYDPDWEALWRSRFDRPLDDAETFVRDGTGHLVDIGGRPRKTAEVHGQYLGLLRFTPESWAVVRDLRAADPVVRELDMTGLLRYLVRTKVLSVATVPTEGPWCEFDHPRCPAPSSLDVRTSSSATTVTPRPTTP